MHNVSQDSYDLLYEDLEEQDDDPMSGTLAAASEPPPTSGMSWDKSMSITFRAHTTLQYVIVGHSIDIRTVTPEINAWLK